MNKLRLFLDKNSIYVLMLIFIILFNVGEYFTSALDDSSQEIKEEIEKKQAQMKEKIEEKEETISKNITGHKELRNLAAIITFFSLILILAGFGLLITFITLKIRKQDPLPKMLSPPHPKWGILDAVRIAILFLFFSYIFYFIEGFLLGLFHIQPEAASIAILNTVIMDLLALGFVLYFIFVKYGQRLKAIGLSLKDFLQNSFLGTLGYLAFLPLLIGVGIISYVMADYFKLEPQTQPLFDLFLEEKRIFILAILVLFVAVIGPIIEEIFFRGFLYPAMKKKMRPSYAMLLTSLIFSALHLNTIGFLPIFVLALILVYMFEKTGSLVPSIVIHCLHNTIIVFFLFLMRFFSRGF